MKKFAFFTGIIALLTACIMLFSMKDISWLWVFLVVVAFNCFFAAKGRIHKPLFWICIGVATFAVGFYSHILLNITKSHVDPASVQPQLAWFTLIISIICMLFVVLFYPKERAYFR